MSRQMIGRQAMLELCWNFGYRVLLSVRFGSSVDFFISGDGVFDGGNKINLMMPSY